MMLSINKNNCMEIIAERFSDFQPFWEAELEYWGHEAGLHGNMTFFSDYVAELLIENKAEKRKEIHEIFEFIENLVRFGDEEVQNAACTCFLENLTNIPSKIPPERYLHILGKESVAYCKAWDIFQGAQTPGLWSGKIGNLAWFFQRFLFKFKTEIRLPIIKLVACLKKIFPGWLGSYLQVP